MPAISELLCRVASMRPFRCTLDPDAPAYGQCRLTIDFTDALLVDLGPSLLLLYASYAGPPITRAALVELAQSVISIDLERATRDEVLARVQAEYPAVLARGREWVVALG